MYFIVILIGINVIVIDKFFGVLGEGFITSHKGQSI